ncbi:MAG: hypothetical protein R2795_03020 [Saprospiraceae bacterium]
MLGTHPSRLNFEEAGTGTGIYESIDGWPNSNVYQHTKKWLPFRVEGAGRVGLALGYLGKTTRLYVAIDNYNRRPAAEEKDTGLSKIEVAQYVLILLN